MRWTMMLVLALLVSGMAVAQPTTWKVDPAHSSITFSVDYMVLTEVRGNFKEFSAAMTSEGDEPEKSSVNVSIKTASVNTENEKRDAHLRSADFFDAGKYPEITFVSKSFEKGDGNRYTITGDLTMRGITKSVVLDATYMGQAKDPWGNTRGGFKGTTTINRYDFGLKYNSKLETGGVLISENVTVTINAQFVKQQEQAAKTK